MSPQNFTSRFLHGLNRVAVGFVAHGEHPPAGNRDGGNTSADRGIPKSLGPSRAPFFEPARFL